jgi:hypothetical protein
VPLELLLAWAWYCLALVLFLHTLGMPRPSRGPPGALGQLWGCMVCCAHGRMGGAMQKHACARDRPCFWNPLLVQRLWASFNALGGMCVQGGGPGGGLLPLQGSIWGSVGVRCFDGEPHASIACASWQQPSHVAKVEIVEVMSSSHFARLRGDRRLDSRRYGHP